MNIAFTPGEPAGIGLDLAIIHAQTLDFDNHLLIFSAADALRDRAKALGLNIRLLENQAPRRAGDIDIFPIPTKAKVIAGRLNPDNAHFVLETLNKAINFCLLKKSAALLTGPVHKGIINQAGIYFSGHSEYLAKKTKAQAVMMLANDKLKVALATTHLPLKEVASYITKTHLKQVIEIIRQDLRRYFKINKPNIAVCGLNPHAGEGGYLGNEELKIINPVIAKLRKTGLSISDALAADTLFTPENLVKYDVFLAMYHDQGLPVLKALGFKNSVNITLGLPFLRTSVDHGSALELAGSGNISLGSLKTAIHYINKCTHFLA